MRLRKTITTIVATAILLAGWQLFAVIANQPELIPSLPRLVRTLCEWLVSGSFYQSVGATILRGILGMSISFVCAIGMAGLFARFEWVYELFRPLLAIMRSIPVISFILLALIFLNPESIPLMIAFLTMFPLLTENLTRGILDLRPGLSIMARQFHIKRSNVLFQIIYPQLKPFLYSGLASAAGFGWRAIIMGEVLAQCAFGSGSEMKGRKSLSLSLSYSLGQSRRYSSVSYLTKELAKSLISPLKYLSRMRIRPSRPLHYQF